MEYLVLQSYLEFKLREIKDIVKEIGKVGIEVLIALIAFAIMMVPSALNYDNAIRNIGLVGAIMSCIILKVMRDIKDIINSKLNIRKKDEQYVEMIEWLKEIKYTKKEQIKQLCYRCEQIVEKNEKKQKATRDVVKKFVFTFNIPIVLAIAQYILTLEGDELLKFEIIIIIMLYRTGIFLIEIGAVKALRRLFSIRQQGMEKMVEDLYGILDRYFPVEEKDLIK